MQKVFSQEKRNERRVRLQFSLHLPEMERITENIGEVTPFE
jgi:hypothetical protein